MTGRNLRAHPVKVTAELLVVQALVVGVPVQPAALSHVTPVSAHKKIAINDETKILGEEQASEVQLAIVADESTQPD